MAPGGKSPLVGAKSRETEAVVAMTAQTIAWRKPELIVLVRGRPEEAVLGACKTGGALGPGDQESYKNCKLRGSSCLTSSRS
jgi:hypothetical protein